MSKIVLDASALLALINQESGHEQVEKSLPHAIMSAVNVSEVMAVLINLGIPDNEAERIVYDLIEDAEPFNREQALIAAFFRKHTRQYGLSLGDRACLSLAKAKNLPVMSADKVWNKVNVGVTIQIIR